MFHLVGTNIHSIKCCLALPSPCTCTLYCDIMLVTYLPYSIGNLWAVAMGPTLLQSLEEKDKQKNLNWA